MTSGRTRRGRIAPVVVASALLLLRLAGASPAGAAPGDLSLVSTSATGVKSNGSSVGVGVSANGRWIAFSSAATNLAGGDTDSIDDVFVKDVVTGAVTLASTSDSGTKGNGQSADAEVSDDGTKVMFTSKATNLGEGDADDAYDVYLKDLTTGALTLVSSSDTGVDGNGISITSAMSADGTLVAFASEATNLGEGDTDAGWDVYVKSIATGALRLVSTSDAGVKGNLPSWSASMSADGTTVAFSSDATNFGEGDTDRDADIYVKVLSTGTLTLASRSLTGDGGNSESRESSLSADGTVVAFQTKASNLSPDDPDTQGDVLVRNLSTGTLQVASRTAAGTKGNGWTSVPYLSRDGSKVGFASVAPNLAGETDTDYDSFVKDLPSGALTLVSTSDTGVIANAGAHTAALSGNGRAVVVTSEATNLGEGDTDSLFDVFLKEVPGPAAPVATGDAYGTPAGSSLVVAAPGVLSNDSDGDPGDALRAVAGTGPAHGTLALAANGGFTYTPTTGYVGPDSFTYRATDGSSTSAAATVTLTVTQPNRPPVASAGTDQTVDHNAGFTLRSSATDADGDALTYAWTQVGGPAAVIRNPDSAETAVDGRAGPATLVFRVTVTDPSGASSTDEVTVTVKAK